MDEGFLLTFEKLFKKYKDSLNTLSVLFNTFEEMVKGLNSTKS